MAQIQSLVREHPRSWMVHPKKKKKKCCNKETPEREQLKWVLLLICQTVQMWGSPISFTFLLHHPLGPRCWSYPCDLSCIMPMSILQPAWKEKEHKWRVSYFLLSKFHLQSHSIAEELVNWQQPLQGRLGSLISTWLAHTLLKTPLPKKNGEMELSLTCHLPKVEEGICYLM